MLDLIRLKFKITRAASPDSYSTRDLLIEKSDSPRMDNLDERKPAQVKDHEKQEFYEVALGFFILFVVSGLMVWWKLRKGARVN